MNTQTSEAAEGPTLKVSLGGQLLLGLLSLIGKLPLTFRQKLGRGIGSVFGSLPTRERRIAELQLKTFLPHIDHKKITSKVFAGLGQTVLEGLNLTPIANNHQETIRCRQPELFQWIISQQRPVLGLTAHTGNWELFAAYLHAIGVPIVAIGRPARISILHEALVSLRSGAGIKILWRTGRAGVRDIVTALKKKYVIGALIDQDTRVVGIPIPFFGLPASTPTTLIELAKKFDALIVAGFIVRLPDNTYEFEVRRLNEAGSVEEILKEYSAALEELIRVNPEQWVWFHKRWRTLPSGERLSASNYEAFLKERNKNG